MGKGSENTLVDCGTAAAATTCTTTTTVLGQAQQDDKLPVYTWSEIRKHDKKSDCWIVVNHLVYDVTKFQNKHPGGNRILKFYGGHDATEVFNAFHKELDRVGKFAKLYLIGRVCENEDDTVKVSAAAAGRLALRSKQSQQEFERRKALKKDFEELRKIAIDMGLFKPSYLFFFLHGFQIVFLHYIAYFIFGYFGASYTTLIIAGICQTIAQAQAGWTQHDYGHSSLLTKPKYNRYLQMFFLGFIKGASADWWCYMHNQHHAKPNVIDEDPDVRIDPVFVLGKVEPVRKAERNVKHNEKYLYPYTWQHFYFPFAAPLLFPVYFQIMTVRYAIIRRKYWDLLSMLPFYVLHYGILVPILGLSQTLAYTMIVKMIDSAWFTWVSQCNHIVMDVHDDDPHDTWLNLQLKATCNITKSTFNDWFTGHLNFQIEHHLFPTMPRHNLYKIQPLVQSLSKKYNVRYVVKPLGQAFMDIILSLRKSGELWKEAYDELIAGM